MGFIASVSIPVVRFMTALRGFGVEQGEGEAVVLKHCAPVYRLTTPLLEPQATNSPLGETAMVVPLRQPSSTKQCTHSRADMSHTYTLPSPAGRIFKNVSRTAEN